MARINIGDLGKQYDKYLRELKSKAKGSLGKSLKKEIVNQILKGKSPVKGRKFEKYSDSYRDAILKGRYSRFRKRLKPVNLKLSGKMLKSIRTKVSKNRLEVYFESDLADYHNEGSGNLPRRAILPINEKKEDFNTKINKLFVSEVKRLVNKYF